VIEDHDILRENTLLALKAHDLPSWGVASAEAFYREALVDPPNIVLIDLGLPGEDGVSAIRHLRQLPELGIIAVTARGAMRDRLEGMAAGADHYLVKPVELSELIAAITSLWRRQSPTAAATALVDKPTEKGAGWRLDAVTSRMWSPDGRAVALTGNELTLLCRLAANAGELVDKRDLSQSLFPGEAGASYHRVEVTVSRLRTKFKAQGLALPLRVVFGRGMALIEPTTLSSHNPP
jgi:DNA-binding response OmpR family regulator